MPSLHCNHFLNSILLPFFEWFWTVGPVLRYKILDLFLLNRPGGHGTNIHLRGGGINALERLNNGEGGVHYFFAFPQDWSVLSE